MPTQPSSEQVFSSATQEAIFHFTIVLAQEYTTSGKPFIEGIHKAADWLESLAKDLHSKAQGFSDEQSEKEKKLYNHM